MEHLVTTFPVAGDNVVEEWRYVDGLSGEGTQQRMEDGRLDPCLRRDDTKRGADDTRRRRVYINKAQYFEGIDREVWEFHIGGYQVLQKWLKDRKGRTLSGKISSIIRKLWWH